MRLSDARARGWAGPLAGGLIVLALVLGSASAWVRAARPNLDVWAGPYHVLSRTTAVPGCRSLVAVCPPGAGRAPRPTARYYTIWVLRSSELRVGSRLQIQLKSLPLLTIPIHP